MSFRIQSETGKRMDEGLARQSALAFILKYDYRMEKNKMKPSNRSLVPGIDSAIISGEGQEEPQTGEGRSPPRFGMML
ncbi:Uncharacterised protein [Candidatus Gugararchaeum adminiculabundum]|nr:Uncharacterised protein [Candidatus Gugararchaeum adminiculabundum]